ncbi:MAG: ZIP family metal transporter [Candidatus Altimarinota bacterium]
MSSVVLYSLSSAFLVSLISFVGVITLSFKRQWLHKILFFIISLAAGALLGDAFIHLLPEIVEESGEFSVQISLLVLLGILSFLVLEKFVLWHHHHEIETPEDHAQHQHHHQHSLGIMNMIGGALHDFLDGMVIAASFLVSPLVGVSTTIAVILHEIPQEIGDFGVFIHSGFGVRKALLINFFSGLLGLVGAGVVLLLNEQSEVMAQYLIPFTAGAFIYIAGSDLIPELKKEKVPLNSVIQLFSLILGIVIMYALTWLE